MSKKTRKKTPKAGPKPARTAAKKSGSVASRSAAKTAAKTTARKPAAKATKASHKPASKRLKAATPAPAKPKHDASAAATPAKSTVLSEGAKAPVFQLPRDGGGSVSLTDYSGRKLVIFFYPRADTPGCTKEAIDFTRLAGAFAESQTDVVGISADPLSTQESFRDKHQLAIPLLSDQGHKILQAYGAWGEKSMYGRTFLGILRTTVLIGADGRIARIWRNVKVDGHADEVLAAARGL